MRHWFLITAMVAAFGLPHSDAQALTPWKVGFGSAIVSGGTTALLMGARNERDFRGEWRYKVRDVTLTSAGVGLAVGGFMYLIAKVSEERSRGSRSLLEIGRGKAKFNIPSIEIGPYPRVRLLRVRF